MYSIVFVLISLVFSNLNVSWVTIVRLVCTAVYNDGDGDRKYLPQFFKFIVANPLSVRTKVQYLAWYI